MGLLSFLGGKESKVGEETIAYEGFELIYSQGTSIVERYKKNGSYEPELIDYIIKDIRSKQRTAVFLDIGANVGMISLSVLNREPEMKIFAFEPGPHQNELFQKTIEHNKLGDKVTLSDVALSNETGTAQFSIHASADASGDGFVDTERAGKTKTVTVQTDTLDNWWESQGKPSIGYVKVDTEGAEFWILQGAREMLAQERPILYLEINDRNIKNYPFEIADLLNLLKELNYDLFTFSGEVPTSENIIEHIRKEDTFVAYYHLND